MAFLGMRGTGTWETGQDPQSWRERILYQFPNGDTPLTAVTSMIASREIKNTIHNWWIELDPTMGGDVANVYINAAMSTAYVYATHQAAYGIAGATVYVKVAAAVAKEMNAGAEVRLIDKDYPESVVIGKVTDVNVNGANSRLAVKLSEADDNGTASYSLATVDYIQIAGHIQPQGAPLPDSIHYNPTPYSNYTQIFEEVFKMTRTARQTELRTGDQYQQDKIKTLQRMAKKMELAMIHGIKTTGTGANGEPELTMQGIIDWVRTNMPTHVQDYRYDTDFTGKAWTASGGGEDFMDKMVEILGRWGPSERLALCGSGAMDGISKLAKANSHIHIAPGPKDAYGINITTWYGQVTLHLMRAPLFSRFEVDRYKMLIFDPKDVEYLYIDDVHFKEDPSKDKAGPSAIDGTQESFLAEATLEFGPAENFALLDGIGKANALS